MLFEENHYWSVAVAKQRIIEIKKCQNMEMLESRCAGKRFANTSLS